MPIYQNSDGTPPKNLGGTVFTSSAEGESPTVDDGADPLAHPSPTFINLSEWATFVNSEGADPVNTPGATDNYYTIGVNKYSDWKDAMSTYCEKSEEQPCPAEECKPAGDLPKMKSLLLNWTDPVLNWKFSTGQVNRAVSWLNNESTTNVPAGQDWCEWCEGEHEHATDSSLNWTGKFKWLIQSGAAEFGDPWGVGKNYSVGKVIKYNSGDGYKNYQAITGHRDGVDVIERGWTRQIGATPYVLIDEPNKGDIYEFPCYANRFDYNETGADGKYLHPQTMATPGLFYPTSCPTEVPWTYKQNAYAVAGGVISSIGTLKDYVPTEVFVEGSQLGYGIYMPTNSADPMDPLGMGWPANPAGYTTGGYITNYPAGLATGSAHDSPTVTTNPLKPSEHWEYRSPAWCAEYFNESWPWQVTACCEYDRPGDTGKGLDPFTGAFTSTYPQGIILNSGEG
jgi:hypothetical protein